MIISSIYHTRKMENMIYDTREQAKQLKHFIHAEYIMSKQAHGGTHFQCCIMHNIETLKNLFTRGI